MLRILIADDDTDTCRYIQRHLSMEADLSTKIEQVDVAHDRDTALELMQQNPYALLILDLWMPDHDGNVDREAGMKILEEARNLVPQPETILITGHSSLDSVLRASGLGILDYVLRPIDYGHLISIVRQGLEKFAFHTEIETHDITFDADAFIGVSESMMQLMKEVGQIAHTNADVLLFGESGTGKDMLARAIHRNSPRKGKPFVPVNCSAIPAELIESELFGIEGRVATAVDARAGKFMEADGGTLFLDEIGELSLTVQPKLLRALDTKEIQRVGGGTKQVDVRIIAATNRDLRMAVGEKVFRADLYFRLSGVSIHLPPLRERREDIPPLADHFLNRYRQEFKKRFIAGFAQDVWDLLNSHLWPGNVRELERVIKYAVTTCNRRQITRGNLPMDFSDASQAVSSKDPTIAQLLQIADLRKSVAQFERIFIEHHLQKNDWNVKQTAAQLGIARQVLHRKIKHYGLHRHSVTNR